MRKCNTKFHSKRSSGRAVRSVYYNSKLEKFVTEFHDFCAFANSVANDKRMQLASNSLLTGLLNRVGVFA